MNQPLEWHTEQRRVNDLIPLEINPRRISEARRMKMIESLQRFNLVDIPVVDFDATVVSGHQRLRALQAIGRGDELIDVRMPNRKLTERELKEYNVLANTHFGEFDEDLFGEFFSDVDLEGLGLEEEDLFGASIDEPEPLKLEAKEDDYEVPEVIVTDIVPGDLFDIGPHRLLCGDSTSADDVAKVMRGEKADLLFTSPPYGAAGSAGIRDHYEKDAEKLKTFYLTHDDKPNKWLELIEGFFNSCSTFSKSQIVNIQMLADNKKPLIKWVSNNSEKFVDIIIWDKKSGAPQMHPNILSNAFEFLFVFGGNGTRTIPFSEFHGTLQNIVRIATKGHNEFSDVHRATMPVLLPFWIMNDLCSLAESIIDPFLGTGTTMVAAHQLNRRCYGIEIDPKYCQIIVDRMLRLDPTLEIKRNGQPYKTTK